MPTRPKENGQPNASEQSTAIEPVDGAVTSGTSPAGKSPTASARKSVSLKRSAREPLKTAGGEAKPKSKIGGVAPTEVAAAAQDGDALAVETSGARVAPSNPAMPETSASDASPVRAAAKASASVVKKDSVSSAKAGDETRTEAPGGTTSRDAAAAFVAARRKMASAQSVLEAKKGSNAVKGLVDVVDRDSVDRNSVDRNSADKTVTTDAEVAAPVAPPVAVAARPAMPERAPFPPKPVVKPMAANGKGHGFKTQEFIVYPAHGVGQIVAVEEQEVAGYKLELFVISFAKDKMILKVPLPKIASVGMRKLAEPPVMKRALDTLTGRARVKRTMWSRRAQEYEAKINSGDLVSIAEVVRDLYRSDAQPEQSYSERQLYEAALDRMAREIAAVDKITDTEALKMIDDQLQKGPRRGKVEEADSDDADEGDEAVAEPGIGEAA